MGGTRFVTAFIAHIIVGKGLKKAISAACGVALIHFSSMAGAQDYVTVYEFYHSGLNHYFRTADASEAGGIDSGAAGPGWVRTGDNFQAYSATSAPSWAVPVCRFYGSMSPGPNSHFYTADQTECDGLKALQLSTPASQKRWNYEGLAFAVTLPATSECAIGSTAIYRLYNNGYSRGEDSNHRYTTLQSEYQRLQTAGWSGEGVVMCSPSSMLSPPTNVAVVNVESQTVGSSVFSSSTKLMVTWAKPSGYTVDHYIISALETSGNTSLSMTATSSDTSATLTALKSGTSYSVVVIACNDAACSQTGNATAVTGTTSEEYWQLQGAGSSTSGLTRIVSDGNVRISATRFGSDAGTSTADRIQLYYGPNAQTSQLQALSTAVTGSATNTASPSSYLSFISSGATTGLISPSTAAPLVKTVATGQGVPLSVALGGKVRLFFEATGADNKTRIFTIDSQDGYVGQDFNSGNAKTCSTPADYSTGGGCALTLEIGVEGDSTGANSKITNARQHKVGFPTLSDWRWDGAAGTFMVFTTDSVSGCSTSNMNHGYAVWDGSKWVVQYEASGCPKLFKNAQAVFPLHIGGVRYKLYYGDPSVTTGKLTSQLPFLGPKKLIYADGTLTGQADRVDFEDWESQSVARNVVFLWPNGTQFDNTAEGYIDDYHFLTPTASLDLQVMYLAITNGSEIPFGAAAVLQNP